MAVQPGPEPLGISVPAVIRVSKESLLARAYCAPSNVGVSHRVVAYQSLPMMLPDLWRHAHSLGVTSSPMPIPVVNSFHRLSAFCAVEYSSLNRARPLTFPVFCILIPDFQNLFPRHNLLYRFPSGASHNRMFGSEGEMSSTPGSVSQLPDPGKTRPCTCDDVWMNTHPIVYVIRPERISGQQ